MIESIVTSLLSNMGCMGSKKEGASGNTAVVPAVATDEKSSTSETVAESIATDPPKEEASADAAKAEAPAAEAPAAEATTTESSPAEEAPADAAKSEAPAAETPTTEAPAESTATDSPIAEEATPADTNDNDDDGKKELLRRWHVSWQFHSGIGGMVGGEGGSIDETIHGPVKLHYDNKVISVGSGEDCQLKIANDPEIDAEHGMISFKAEQLLYVNSSDKPTKLDDVDVDAEAGPTNLKNGAVLKIGGTSLIITAFTEMD